MTSLIVQAFGKPEPQGSTKAFVRGGRAITTSANPQLRPWRDTVAWAAREAMDKRGDWEMLTGAVLLTAAFYLPRPKSEPRTRDTLPVRGVDGDKLLRAVCDSLTNAGVWRDDSQVVDYRVTKRFAVGPDLPKIYIPEYHWPQPGCSLLIQEV